MIVVPDIIGNFLASTRFGGDVVSIAYDSGTDTSVVETERLYHARPYAYVLIDGVRHQVTATDRGSKTFSVSGDVTGATLWQVELNYFHGTPVTTNDQIDATVHDKQYPMAYLYQILRETYPKSKSSIGKRAEIRLFLLDLRDDLERTDELYDSRIYGLSESAELIISDLRRTARFETEETEFTKIDYPKWGEFQTMKGVVNSVFNARTSGVELQFTLNIYKPCN